MYIHHADNALNDCDIMFLFIVFTCDSVYSGLFIDLVFILFYLGQGFCFSFGHQCAVLECFCFCFVSYVLALPWLYNQLKLVKKKKKQLTCMRDMFVYELFFFGEA